MIEFEFVLPIMVVILTFTTLGAVWIHALQVDMKHLQNRTRWLEQESTKLLHILSGPKDE